VEWLRGRILRNRRDSIIALLGPSRTTSTWNLPAPYSPEKSATVEIVQHATDDLLERYAMQALPGSDVIPLENHLLTCPECLERLQAELEFVTAMRDAAVTMREVEKS
jgi:hypothetical protein